MAFSNWQNPNINVINEFHVCFLKDAILFFNVMCSVSRFSQRLNLFGLPVCEDDLLGDLTSVGFNSNPMLERECYNPGLRRVSVLHRWTEPHEEWSTFSMVYCKQSLCAERHISCVPWSMLYWISC